MLKLQDIVGNIFRLDEQEQNEQATQTANLQQTTDKVFGTNQDGKYTPNALNPFLNRDGSLFNPMLNYEKILDNPNVSSKAKEYIQQATGYTATGDEVSGAFNFNASADENNLASLDVTKELPKLSASQISDIISKHFSKSTVIKPSDASGIYNAQQKSGMSALAILGIGALESGYGTSSIAKQKNNLWGWNATNVNPAGNAKSFSPISSGALEFANSFLNTYYNKYGAKSIYAAGTGNNPAGKGYAYFNNGSINPTWATNVGSIMKAFYQTAKGAASSNKSKKTTTTSGNYSSGKYVKGKRIANTASYNAAGAKGQCVWYVRGRAKEKLGINLTHKGDGNQQYTNAPAKSKVSASTKNIKPNMLVSYKYGTSTAGQTHGHVIFIEDVVGDIVYYTEGGSGYYKSGTDGVVKTATRQGILDGVNTDGGRMGSVCLGFVDITKLK